MDINTQFLNERLRVIGTSWDDLQFRSSEIILFGSAACGLASKSSDVDILCVGSGETRITDSVDLLWVTAEMIRESPWIGSEIAGHIAEYGKWLKGTGQWVRNVSLSEDALNRKRNQVACHIRATMRYWDVFKGVRRQRQLQLIRRQLQRLIKLATETPVPPSPLLDEEWNLVREKSIPEWGLISAIEPEEIRFLSKELGRHC